MKAFPNPTLSDTQNNSAENLNNESLYGMDLRDYFAAKAMQGLVSAFYQSDDYHGWKIDEIAHESYRIANEMMEARNDS